MVYTRGSLIKHSEQTLFIRFHSANKINRKRPLTASLCSYVTTLRRAPSFSTFRTHDSLKSTAQQLSTVQLQAYNDVNAAKPP